MFILIYDRKRAGDINEVGMLDDTPIKMFQRTITKEEIQQAHKGDQEL